MVLVTTLSFYGKHFTWQPFFPPVNKRPKTTDSSYMNIQCFASQTNRWNKVQWLFQGLDKTKPGAP